MGHAGSARSGNLDSRKLWSSRAAVMLRSFQISRMGVSRGDGEGQGKLGSYCLVCRVLIWEEERNWRWMVAMVMQQHESLVRAIRKEETGHKVTGKPGALSNKLTRDSLPHKCTAGAQLKLG